MDQRSGVFPEVPAANVPYLTAEQMRTVDRLMIERYGIVLLQMMENAGRSLAVVARDRFLSGKALGGRVVVLAGSGGNGGGGLVCARRLSAWGAEVEVHLAQPPNALQPATAHQLDALRRMQVPVHVDSSVTEIGEDAALIIDALLGYSLVGAPYGATLRLIEAANAHPSPVLALDVPSGVQATTGETPGAVVHANATLTLALPKTGLKTPPGEAHVGELYLADIGVPPALFGEIEPAIKSSPVFSAGDIVRIV